MITFTKQRGSTVFLLSHSGRHAREWVGGRSLIGKEICSDAEKGLEGKNDGEECSKNKDQ